MQIEQQRRKWLGISSAVYVGWVLGTSALMIIGLRAPGAAVTVVIISGLAVLLGAALLFGSQVLGRLPSPGRETARLLRIVGYLVYPGFLVFLVVNGLPFVLLEGSFFADAAGGTALLVQILISILLYAIWVVSFARWHATLHVLEAMPE